MTPTDTTKELKAKLEDITRERDNAESAYMAVQKTNKELEAKCGEQSRELIDAATKLMTWRSPEEYAELEKKNAYMRTVFHFIHDECDWSSLAGGDFRIGPACDKALAFEGGGKGYKSPAEVREMLEPVITWFKDYEQYCLEWRYPLKQRMVDLRTHLEALVKEAK